MKSHYLKAFSAGYPIFFDARALQSISAGFTLINESRVQIEEHRLVSINLNLILQDANTMPKFALIFNQQLRLDDKLLQLREDFISAQESKVAFLVDSVEGLYELDTQQWQDIPSSQSQLDFYFDKLIFLPDQGGFAYRLKLWQDRELC